MGDNPHLFSYCFGFWMILITVLSLVSGLSVSAPEMEDLPLDKIAHFTFYFWAVLLGLQSWREFTGQHVLSKKTLLLAVVLASFYGTVIEALQYSLTADRSAEWGDFWANVLGALSGSALTMRLKDKIWALKTRLK